MVAMPPVCSDAVIVTFWPEGPSQSKRMGLRFARLTIGADIISRSSRRGMSPTMATKRSSCSRLCAHPFGS